MSHEPRRPEPSEYPEYFGRYVEQVPDGPILELLETELNTTLELLGGVSPEQETYRYEPGKWSVREVVGHLLDTERVMGDRALFMARDESRPLPSMEHELWAERSEHGRRPLIELAAELELVRRSHVLMLRGLPEAAWRRQGVADGKEFTVRSLPWIMVGHEIHHRRILEEHYLSGANG